MNSDQYIQEHEIMTQIIALVMGRLSTYGQVPFINIYYNGKTRCLYYLF